MTNFQTSTPAGNILKKYLPRFFSKEQWQKLQLQNIFFHWEKFIDKRYVPFIRPVKIDKATLYLHTTSPVFAEWLKWNKAELLQKINQFLQANVLQDVCFTKQQKKSFATKQFHEKILKIPKPTKQDFLKAEGICQSVVVHDEKLRQMIVKTFAQILARKRKLLSLGYHPCPNCQQLIPKKERLCFFCRQKQKEENFKKILQRLKKEPWLKTFDLVREFSCSESLVIDARLTLAQRILPVIAEEREPINFYQAENSAQKNFSLNDFSANEKFLTMLIKSVSPEQLNAPLIQSVLKKFYYDLKNLRGDYATR